MLIMTKKGLFCPRGNFYIDPAGAVENAVITHAHADHARRGSQKYYCVQSGLSLLKARIGKNISAQSFSYQENFELGGVRISFHPAGHILGSSQVRMESDGEVWVASGDYKREYDPTCEPFEIVKCDVFVTEATFGTPTFNWGRHDNLGEEIYQWWQTNASLGLNSIIFAYSLGKTQRILGELFSVTDTPIYCHPAATPIIECYREQGIRLAPSVCLSEVADDEKLSGALLIAPQMFLKTERAKVLGPKFSTAFASGWMANQNPAYGMSYDHGFVMSDHADWNDLVRTITETGAKKVYVQHRGHGALVKHLKSLGLEAYPDSDLFPKNPDQMMLF